jgi:hypothetical protein
MASYRVDFAKSAAKDLRGIDHKWIPRIVASIEALTRISHTRSTAACSFPCLVTKSVGNAG